MKKISYTALCSCLFVLIFSSTLKGQFFDRARYVKSGFTYTGDTIRNNLLSIHFNIVHSGVIDFQLRDEDHNRIWTTNYIKEHGDNQILIRLNSLPKGNIYHFMLMYKGQKILRTFSF